MDGAKDEEGERGAAKKSAPVPPLSGTSTKYLDKRFMAVTAAIVKRH